MRTREILGLCLLAAAFGCTALAACRAADRPILPRLETIVPSDEMRIEALSVHVALVSNSEGSLALVPRHHLPSDARRGDRLGTSPTRLPVSGAAVVSVLDTARASPDRLP